MRHRHPYTKKQRANRIPTLCILAASILSASYTQALNIKTSNNDLKIRWDNTVKYSAAFRVEELRESVVGTSFNPNLDDGDRNFDQGLISNRLDLLSELDIRYKRDFGARISGTALYDQVYNEDNDNDGSGVANSLSREADEFTSDTEETHGRDAEILDAFVFGSFNPGDTRLNIRAGQFTQIYGETLFFGGNGIAAAQASPDIIRATSVPGSQIKEILLPVKQIAAQWQLSPTFNVGFYYQFEWREARLPEAGSFFSFADFVDDGGEQIFTPVGAFRRGNDIDPSDSGQFGFQARGAFGNYEFGLYAAQFHEKFPQFYVRPGANDYVLVYGEDIRTIGASLSTVVGETNVAAEVSYRDNQPLVATGNLVVLSPENANADGDSNPAFPVGETFHINASAISVFGGNSLWDGGSIVAEIAYNRVLDVTDNEDQLDPNASRDAASARIAFTPEYFQVLPQLDVQIPISIGYGLFGQSSVNASGFNPEDVGDISIGIRADYQKKWFASLNFTHFIGDANGIVDENAELSFDQQFADRDFISLSIQRTF